MTYYERNLPHWHPEGAAIFLTWRLHGSLPREQDRVLPESPGKAFVAVDRVLDRAATGPRWLNDTRVAQCVADAFVYGEHQLHLYRLRAWVIMPNHIHILLYPEVEVAKITRTLKGYTARQANAILNRTGHPFWQDESYDRWIRTPAAVERVVRYIETNPIAAGLTDAPDRWPWSSAAL